MGKRQTVDFPEAIVAYDIKVDICSRLNDFFINTKGQDHLLTFILHASDSVFLSSPLKLMG